MADDNTLITSGTRSKPIASYVNGDHGDTDRSTDGSFSGSVNGYTFTEDELEKMFDDDDFSQANPMASYMYERIKKRNDEYDAEKKKRKTLKKLAGIADGLRSFSDMYFAQKGEKGPTTDKPTMSKRLQDRWDKMDAAHDKWEGNQWKMLNRYNTLRNSYLKSRQQRESNGQKPNHYGGKIFGHNYENRADYNRAVYRYVSDNQLGLFDHTTGDGGFIRTYMVPVDELANRAQQYWETLGNREELPY